MVKDWLKKGGDGIINIGDSTGWLFGTDKADIHLIVSLLHDAFDQGYRVLLILDHDMRDEIISYLSEEGISFKDKLSEGIIVHPSGFSCCDTGAPAEVEVIRLFDHETAEAKKSGFSSLFVIADSKCILGISPDESRVHEFKSAADRFIAGKNCILLLGIDRSRNSPSSVMYMIENLKNLVFNGKVLKNPCYIPPKEIPVKNRNSARIDYTLKNILAFNENEEQLKNKVKLLEERREEIDSLLPELRRLKNIVNNSPATAFLWDASEGWPVIFVSQNISNFGYNPVDFYSGNIVFSDIIHPDDVDRVGREVERLTAEGRIEYTQEYRILTSTGEVRWVDDRTIVHRDDSGKPVMFEGVLMDITESKELEEELRLSNEKYSTLFTMNPDAIALSTVAEGKILEVNGRFEDLTGIPRSELIGKSVNDILFYKDPGDREAYISEITEKGSVTNFEVVLFGAGQRTVYTEMSGRLVDIGGQKCILTIIHDITEQRLIREKIRESEERFRAVSEAAIDSIIIIDSDSTVVFWNKAAERMFGYPAEEILGKRFIDIGVPEELKSKPKAVFQSLKEEKMHPFLNNILNFTLMKKGGKKFPVEVSTSAVKIRDSWFIVAIIRDVTERRKYEEKLRVSSAKFKNTFNSIQDALYIIDRDYTIVNINRAFLETLGLRRSEVVGKRCQDVFKDNYDICDSCPVKRVLETAKPCRVELSVKTTKGRELLFDTLGSPIFNKEGEMILVVLSGRDITEMKEYRSAIEEANKKLNLLSQITRHDILNSLTISTGYLSLLEEDAPPDISDYISRLSTSIDTIRRQIEFTRDYQDMGVSPPQWQKLLPVLQACKYQGGGPPEGSDFITDLRDIEIFADQMFEKAVCNIITNAYKHAGGMKSLKVYDKEEGDSLRIIFEDDGPGILEEKKESIFRPGYGREHGYGLFLVKEILGITGIEISETGDPGRGARFEVFVPSGKWRQTE
ncbi:MAG: PAS domain S-box protein [Methanomicrobiaceae archaeon]|nr:PAS domain S-box protein [Methanomicrobiaceae archaeon]